MTFRIPRSKVSFSEEIENLQPLLQEILTADLGRGRSAESETLAEYAGTTKGAIYAARNGARVKIKHALIRRGFLIAEIQDLFSSVVNISLDNGECRKKAPTYQMPGLRRSMASKSFEHNHLKTLPEQLYEQALPSSYNCGNSPMYGPMSVS